MAVSIASILSGYLLEWTGFNETLATQTESTLFWIRFWEIGLPALLCVIAIQLLFKYPLTEERAYQIKALLAERNAATGDAPATG